VRVERRTMGLMFPAGVFGQFGPRKPVWAGRALLLSWAGDGFKAFGIFASTLVPLHVLRMESEGLIA
jgi:hypothetical protein